MTTTHRITTTAAAILTLAAASAPRRCRATRRIRARPIQRPPPSTAVKTSH